MDDLTLRIRVAEVEDLEVAESAAASISELNLEAVTGTPTQEYETQIEPVTAILIGAGVVAAIKFIQDWWERRRGGLVIDQRPGRTDDIYRDRDIPFGFLLVFPPNGGKVEIETRDAPKDATERLLEKAIAGGIDTVAQLANAAREIVGPEKVQESQPSNLPSGKRAAAGARCRPLALAC